MPDQVGTSDISLFLDSRKIMPGTFPYPPFSGATRYSISTGLIKDNYLYVVIRMSGIATTSQLHKIFRINLWNPEQGWEYIANSDYNRFAASESTYYHGSTVGIIGNKFLYYATHSSTSGSSTTSYVSAAYDLDLMTGWAQNIRGVCSNWTPSYQTSVGWFLDMPTAGKLYMTLSEGDDGQTLSNLKLYRTLLWQNRNSLTDNFSQTSTAPYWFGRKVPIIWNGELYLLGGVRSDSGVTGSNSGCGWGTHEYSSGSGNYYTTGSLKYIPASNTWVQNPITGLPNYQFDASTTVLARGNVIYTLRPSINLCHYYDMRSGSNGTWIACPLPDSTGDHRCSLTYDSARNCLWYLNHAGILQRLDLTDDGFPLSPNWESYTNQAWVNSVNTVAPDQAFVLALATFDVYAATADVSFTLTSAAQYISTHPQVGSTSVPFVIAASADGLVGTLNTSAVEMVALDLRSSASYFLTNTGACDFTFDMFGEGNPVLPINNTETPDVRFTLSAAPSMLVDVFGDGQYTPFIFDLIDGIGIANLIGVPRVTTSFTFDSDAEAILSGFASGAATFSVDMFNAIGVVRSVGGALVVPPTTLDAWVVNGHTGGHAAFLNYQFTGIFRLGHTYYATNEFGLYRIEGNTDNAQELVSYAATPVTDLGSPRLKAIPDVYAHMRCNGDSQLRIITDEQTDRSAYLIEAAGREGLHRRRKKVHKGIKGTDWQFEVKSSAGSKLEVAEIEVRPIVLKRTV